MLFEKEQKEFDPTLDLNWTFGERGTKYFSGSIENEDACALIAEIDNKIVGYLVGWIKKVSSHRIMESQAELENMFVLKEFRGSGIGKKLVEYFYEWAKGRGVKNIAVTASAKNEKAIDFYRKCGFEDYDHTLEINF